MRKFLSFFLLLLPYLGIGQGYVDIFSANYQYQPGSGLLPSMDVIQVQAKLPVVLPSKNVILSGLQFNSYSIAPAVVGDAPSAAGSSYLNSTLFTGYKHHFSKGKDLVALGLMKINSPNYQDITANHLQWGGIFNYGFRTKKDQRMTVGSYVNTDLYSFFWVPLVGGDFQLGQKWRIHGNLPITATMDYTLHERVHLGYYFKGTIGSFYVPGSQETYIDQSDNVMQLFADIYVTKNWVLRPYAGVVLGRSYEAYGLGDEMDFRISALKLNDNRELLNPSPVASTAPIFGCSLHFRIPTK